MNRPFGKEQIDALRAVALTDVLAACGAEQDPRDKAKWKTPKGVLSVNSTKFFNWSQDAGGGGAIDLAIHLLDVPFRDAVQWLNQRFRAAQSKQGATISQRRQLLLPQKDERKTDIVVDYLCRIRRLPPSLIQVVMQKGCIYADKRANAVFLLQGKNGKPVGAEIRGTSAIPWRAMAKGSQKDQGYFAVKALGARTVVLCESAIDALSCFAIDPKRTCISTAGARCNPHWLNLIPQKRYQVYCGYDADRTGDQIAQQMIALHPEVKRLRPQRKDWNEMLRR